MFFKILKSIFFTGVGASYVSKATESRIQNDWQTIDTLLNQRGPSQLRQALISADRSLDTALRDVVSGNTMGERLKEAKNRYDKDLYDKIWKAHKMRNALVHEAGFEPPHFAVKEAVNTLKQAIQKLGVKI